MYISGNFIDFESRLHSLPISTGDYTNFINEGCSYYQYISTGAAGDIEYFAVKWNVEFVKKGYLYYPIGTGCSGSTGSGIEDVNGNIIYDVNGNPIFGV